MLDPARVVALARANLLERARRPAFLVLLGVGLWAAWLFTPPNDSAYATVRMADGRGLYGSAWIGTTVAMLTALFFSFAGFYIVKNAIAGDRETRVGEVLAATPISNLAAEVMRAGRAPHSIALAPAGDPRRAAPRPRLPDRRR